MLLFVGLGVLSCDKEEAQIDVVETELEQATVVDNAKVNTLKNATTKKVISKNQLPAKSQSTLAEKYASSTVNRVYNIEQQGYEVMLFHQNDNGTSRTLFPIYFNNDGTQLVTAESEIEQATLTLESFCFEYDYPLNFSLPGGESLTISGDDDWEKLDQWYDVHSESTAFPELKFPVNIIFFDGTKGTLANEEVEEELLEKCSKEITDFIDNLPPGDIFFAEYEKLTQSCLNFDYVYPITFELPEGKQITLEDASAWIQLDEWYENNVDSEASPELVYPVSLLSPEGETIVLQTKEEAAKHLEQTALRCLLLFAFEERLNCYDYVYPIEIVLPNEEKASIENREALFAKATELINAIDFEKVKEEDDAFAIYPLVHYPVQIKWNDGNTQTVQSEEEELTATFENCKALGDIEIAY